MFVLFNPHIADDAKHLPFTAYEAALPEGDAGERADGKFVQLESGIETGEAERIAVDGVTKEASGETDQTGRECRGYGVELTIRRRELDGAAQRHWHAARSGSPHSEIHHGSGGW